MTQAITLDTGIENARNVTRYLFKRAAIRELSCLVDERRTRSGYVVFYVDHFFRDQAAMPWQACVSGSDDVVYVDTTDEPKTGDIDALRDQLMARHAGELPDVVVGIGGGSTLDTAKTISNLLGNGGRAEDYQGWDLLREPGVFKIGVPAISGTGSESTRTCVMTNSRSRVRSERIYSPSTGGAAGRARAGRKP